MARVRVAEQSCALDPSPPHHVRVPISSDRVKQSLCPSQLQHCSLTAAETVAVIANVASATAVAVPSTVTNVSATAATIAAVAAADSVVRLSRNTTTAAF